MGAIVQKYILTVLSFLGSNLPALSSDVELLFFKYFYSESKSTLNLN
jgi:hypothetical protein